jgi:hypothetical protein
VYIYDYLLKRNLQTTAKAFMAEGKVAADPVGNRRRFFCYPYSLLLWVLFATRVRLLSGGRLFKF